MSDLSKTVRAGSWDPGLRGIQGIVVEVYEHVAKNVLLHVTFPLKTISSSSTARPALRTVELGARTPTNEQSLIKMHYCKEPLNRGNPSLDYTRPVHSVLALISPELVPPGARLEGGVQAPPGRPAWLCLLPACSPAGRGAHGPGAHTGPGAA